MDLYERAAEAGDGKATALLQALTEAGISIAVGDGLAPEEGPTRHSCCEVQSKPG